MSRALVFGGTGQLGLAVSKALLDLGWAVHAVARGGRPLAKPLSEAGALRLSGDGKSRQDIIAEEKTPYDAVFDPTCFGAEDAADLLARQERVGAYCVISSASVYKDDQGRTLDEAKDTGFPDFQGPVEETNPTIAPGEDTYSARKVAMEQTLLSGNAAVTILRPCAVYGIQARHPREWWFVKRALDGRRSVPICFEAESIFHTSSATGIASLTRLCLERRDSTILNVADPKPFSVQEIAATVGKAVDHDFELKPFPGPAQPPDFVGRTPWSAENPIALSTDRARSLGWDGGPDYADAVLPVCKWLLDTAHSSDWREHFPSFHRYAFDPFDYQAEDAALTHL